ncbi:MULTISPECIES: DUF4129 domain-containing protein [unclassified Novosphingobium]|uniref:DUF4129 domain-containing protein n=1 Tax=unclassified Novosphingobium TaxID=2644732 RepID=UPI00086F090D|nr:MULTISPECIES: hypothetical protein [unclassified Novosphingobium]MBN9142405.1 hypothetical protein [Novosphingobium sp.]MDR6710384.1 hypothetical protein [Novosphingobium sp. 1748]ODU77932.1 MAG: hypothetical protein ABT10_23720 [Novosphingobium sp. SCN 63-17]OJX88351.1 MAG: hypothetical protein BGP00_08085 [Novosphingobium sp. 63-713]
MSAAASNSVHQAWRAVRDARDLQFTPVPNWTPAPTPDWLKALARFLRDLFEPVGRALGMSWPVMEKILIGLLALGVALLLWRIAARLWAMRRAAPAAPEWSPDAAAARALLDDADALAAQGRFDEATHLLLLRSLEHIAEARPAALTPASTAREIAALSSLSAPARATFGRIAALVEQGRYALRPLEAPDWAAARAAYADFAEQRLA